MSFMIKFNTFDIGAELGKREHDVNPNVIGMFSTYNEAETFRTTMPIRFSYEPGKKLTDKGNLRMHCGDTVIWTTPAPTPGSAWHLEAQKMLKYDFHLNSKVVEVSDGVMLTLDSNYRVGAYTVNDEYSVANACVTGKQCVSSVISILPLFKDKYEIETVISNLPFEWRRTNSANGIANPFPLGVSLREKLSSNAALGISLMVEFGDLWLYDNRIAIDVTVDEANIIVARWRARAMTYNAERIVGI